MRRDEDIRPRILSVLTLAAKMNRRVSRRAFGHLLPEECVDAELREMTELGDIIRHEKTVGRMMWEITYSLPEK